jgi:dienelactone hydrolase
VIILHSALGRTESVLDYAAALAERGFAVYALDFFAGKSATTPSEGRPLRDEANTRAPQLEALVTDAYERLATDNAIQAQERYLVGWSYGAAWATHMAGVLPRLSGVVAYYGEAFSNEETLAERISAPILFVGATRDDSPPPTTLKNVEANLRENGKVATLLLLDAGHGFAERRHPGFDERASVSAFAEVLRFLRNPENAGEGTHESSSPLPCKERAGEVSGEARLLEFEVPGFRTSLLSLPTFTPLRNEPLLLAAHGAGDNAEAQCRTWREIIGPCGMILCPRGTPIGPGESRGYYYKNHLELESEVLGSLKALAGEYGGRVDLEHVVYAAYSQGASMGALMLKNHGDIFSRLVLVEGGDAQWSLETGHDFRRTGGERILFVCGTSSCGRNAKRAVIQLSQAGLTARLIEVPGGGHAYWGPVASALEQAWPWVVQGDPRW